MNPLYQFRIISRGAPGVEKAALEGASKVGMKTERWGNVNRNVREADGVFLIGSKLTSHTKLVENRCKRFGKPLLRTRYSWKSSRNRMLQQAKVLANWILDRDMTTVYVTGNEDERIEGFIEALMITAAQELRRPGCLPSKVGQTDRQKLRRLKRQKRRNERLASIHPFLVKKISNV